MSNGHLRASRSIVIFSMGFSLFVTGCGIKKSAQDTNDSGEMKTSLIYGDDNRQDIYQVASDAQRQLANSTVALVESDSLTAASGGWNLATSSYSSEYGLCTDEPFYSQPVAAFCSGTLVGPRQILTAGHCVTSAASCATTRFVFGFDMLSGSSVRTQFANNQVYKCASIIHREQEAVGQDFAVIELDRDVVGYTPLPIRRGGAITVGTDIYVIGHPSGLPTKVAGGAKVRSLQSEFFVANLDTYGGNSGSGVFNLSTGLIEGILVRGDNDYVYRGSCRVSNRCTDSGCRGEDVTKVSMAASYIPALDGGGSSTPPVSDPPAGSDPSVSRVAASPKLSIPDMNAAGIITSINMADAPGARKVQVEINISHTWIGDLEVSLENPDGKVVYLAKNQGGSADNIKGTYGVTLKAFGNLSDFASTSAGGNWKLHVRDLARYDTGVLNSWALVFQP